MKQIHHRPSIAAAAALVLISLPCSAQKAPQLGKDPVSKIVKAMSLEEKAAVVCGTWSAGFAGEGTVAGKTFKLVSGAAGITEAFDKYGIPHTCRLENRPSQGRGSEDLLLHGLSDRHYARLHLGPGPD